MVPWKFDQKNLHILVGAPDPLDMLFDAQVWPTWFIDLVVNSQPSVVSLIYKTKFTVYKCHDSSFYIYIHIHVYHLFPIFITKTGN